jgi:hypothetical protein
MGLYIKKQADKPKNKVIIPSGSYLAKCVGIIDLGTQETSYEGKTKLVHKVKFYFETLTKKAVFSTEKGEEPFMLTKMYTASFHEKAQLKKDLNSWLGIDVTTLEGFELSDLLGKTCLISVVHAQGKDGNTYANIATVMQVPEGMTVPEGTIPVKSFDLDTFDEKVFDTLYPWDKERIMNSQEMLGKETKTAPNKSVKSEPVDNSEVEVTKEVLDEMFS